MKEREIQLLKNLQKKPIQERMHCEKADVLKSVN